MDQNIYAECLVKVKTKGWVYPALIGASILLALAFLLTMSTEWGFLVLTAVVCGILFGWRFLRLEYEYTFVTDELTIDRIFSASFRKKAVKIEMSKVEEVRYTSTEKIRQQKQNPKAVIEDFSSGYRDAPSYTITYSDGGKMHYLIFEPDEHLLQVMKRCSPRKVTIQENVLLKKNTAEES